MPHPDKIYAQQNSARGLLEALTVDYNNLNFDINEFIGYTIPTNRFY